MKVGRKAAHDEILNLNIIRILYYSIKVSSDYYIQQQYSINILCPRRVLSVVRAWTHRKAARNLIRLLCRSHHYYCTVVIKKGTREPKYATTATESGGGVMGETNGNKPTLVFAIIRSRAPTTIQVPYIYSSRRRKFRGRLC